MRRVLTTLDLVIWAWFFATGLWFLATYRLNSAGAYAAIGTVMAYFAFNAYRCWKRRSVLACAFRCGLEGLRVSRPGKDELVVPWSEIRGVTPKGTRGAFLIATALATPPLLVDGHLERVDEFRNLLREHALGSGRPEEAAVRTDGGA